MRPPGRRGFLSAVLIASGLLAGACARPEGATASVPAAGPTVSYLSLGKHMLAAREPDLAMKAFLTSLGTEGGSAEAMTGAGIAAQRQGLLKSARRYFERALRLAPDSMIANNNLGVVLYRLKEYYPARNAFRRAHALSGGASGMAERNLNLAEAMIARMEEAAKTDPAISHQVVRLGSSEFRLMEIASPDADGDATVE